MQQQIILFRHGEVASPQNIFLGWLNFPLSRKGVQQAKRLAQKLRCEVIDFGFCSDQIRSQQALVEVLHYHPNSKAIIDHRLRERHYGVFSGKSKDLFRKLYPEKFKEIHRGYYASIPEGENLEQVGKRIFPFMNQLLHFMQREKCSVAISAHASSMRLIQEYLENLSPFEVIKLEQDPIKYKKYILNFG